MKSSSKQCSSPPKYLKIAGEVLKDQVDDVLDLWYGFVGSHPHLVYYFSGLDGKPDANYLGAVRQRFGQWILDTCTRPYDQTWLDYQHEIGLRHHRTKKNKTDNVRSVPNVPLRYLIFYLPHHGDDQALLGEKGAQPRRG